MKELGYDLFQFKQSAENPGEKTTRKECYT